MEFIDNYIDKKDSMIYMLQLANHDIYATVEKKKEKETKQTKYNNKQSWRPAVESDAAKLINDDSSSDAEDILTLTINQATKKARVQFIWCDYFFDIMGL